MTYAYIRVSTKEQNLARQIEAIKRYRPNISDENIICDKQSGKNFNRAGYTKLKSLLQPGDELIVKEFDRFERGTSRPEKSRGSRPNSGHPDHPY